MPQIRLPDPKEVDDIIAGNSERAKMGERKLKTAVDNALKSIAPTAKTEVLKKASLSDSDATALLKKSEQRLNDTDRTRLKKLIAEIQKADPSGLSRYPGAVEDTRTLTSEEGWRIRDLAMKVVAKMREIASGLHDTYVENVFGKAEADDAKKIFHEAADALDALRPGILLSGDIVVDTMRKSDVWCCAGLTRPGRMALSEQTVATATDRSVGGSAFLTLVHESTHAIPNNRATTDKLYEHHQGFLKASAQTKLTTADYYKEVVRQIATQQGRVFMPGDVAPHLGDARSNKLQQAAVVADKILSSAWVTAIRIHDIIHPMARTPGSFVGWETWLRNASRLIGITLHRETTLKFERNLLTANAGPKITAGDLAVIDNKIAMLAACNGKAKHILLEPLPKSDAQEAVDHVLKQVLFAYCGDLKFRKDMSKDVIVIRSLAECHEAVNSAGKNLLVGSGSLQPGLAQLPEPMKTYIAGKGNP